MANALGHITTFGDYDAHGRLGYIAAPDGKTTRFSYTERGLLRSRTATAGAVSETTSYDYDGAGLRKMVTQADGVVITMAYDDAHRLTRIIIRKKKQKTI